MSEPNVFDREMPLPDDELAARSRRLLGFDTRYARVRDHLRLMLSSAELVGWNKKYHGGHLGLCDLVSEQYPLAIFHGDVGTGKTAMAECIANRLVTEARVQDSVLFKLSNRVRGRGRVGEMGTGVSDAFGRVVHAAGKGKRAILLIDEGDSLGASRSQEHSHHEDKVAVNSLIQSIDDLRRLSGRILVVLCTNRISAIDPALLRRAAIIEHFSRPDDKERLALFEMDLTGLGLNGGQVRQLVDATGPNDNRPGWSYSDIRTRLYPAALAKAYPDRALGFEDLVAVVATMKPSPVMADH
jgi:SpoVK/Ycf46/Vps4 family AAA+-type ATPase